MNKLCDIPLGLLVEGACRINREQVNNKREAVEWIESIKTCTDNLYFDLDKKSGTACRLYRLSSLRLRNASRRSDRIKRYRRKHHF